MKTVQSFEIRDVTIWNPDGILENQTVRVHNGFIEAIGSRDELNSHRVDTVYHADGLVLMPAGVDPQVHLRVPGQKEKETAKSGLQAAIRGGVGALLTMPNTKPVIDETAVCEMAWHELEHEVRETGVTVLLSAAISKAEKGQEPVDFSALARWGVAAFTDDGVGVVADQVMLAAFDASAKTGCPILQHAEIPGHGGVLAPSSIQNRLGVTAYPASAEFEMVARDLKLLQDVPGARYHVLHVSSAKTVELVEEARQKKLQVTCEVSPHHLWFSGEDIDEDNSSFKMNPPLRSPEDRQYLRQALREGTIDFVATDHAPHEKAAKGSNLKTSAYGTIGLETSLKVLLSLYHAGELSAERLVQVFSTRPAEFLKIHNRFGRIAKARPFNAVLVDPDRSSVVKAKDFHSHSKNSCFIGSELWGSVEAVFLEENIHQFSKNRIRHTTHHEG
jgi:dihydroorotase